jgi:hypothetical protein
MKEAMASRENFGFQKYRGGAEKQDKEVALNLLRDGSPVLLMRNKYPIQLLIQIS